MNPKKPTTEAIRRAAIRPYMLRAMVLAIASGNASPEAIFDHICDLREKEAARRARIAACSHTVWLTSLPAHCSGCGATWDEAQRF